MHFCPYVESYWQAEQDVAFAGTVHLLHVGPLEFVAHHPYPVSQVAEVHIFSPRVSLYEHAEHDATLLGMLHGSATQQQPDEVTSVVFPGRHWTL